jgi:hypothetical protein
MSSPLDGRIRKLAREEATQALLGVGQPNHAAPDTAGLQQQITDLHEHLHHAATAIDRLGKRIDALEAAAGPVNADTLVGATAEAPRTRGRRKTTEE